MTDIEVTDEPLATGRHRASLVKPQAEATGGRRLPFGKGAEKPLSGTQYLGKDARLIPVIGLVSVVTALLQAVAVLMIAASSLALVQGGHHVKVSVGPVHHSLSIGVATGVSTGCALLMIGLQLSVGRLTATLAKKAEAECRRRVMTSYLAASWEQVSRRERGELQQILTNNVNRVSRGIVYRSAYIFSLANLVILVGAAFVLAPLLALIMMAGAGLLAIPLRPIRRRTDAAAKAHGIVERRYATFVAGLVEQSREARVFHVRGQIGERSDALNEDASEHQRKIQILVWTAPAIYLGGVLLILTLAIAVLANVGRGHIDELGPMVLLLMRSLVYGQSALSSMQFVLEGSPYMRELDDHVAMYTAAAESNGTRDPGPLQRLELRGAGYQYPETRSPALSDINLEIDRGMSIGLVGSTGSGKSTMAEVVLRLRELTSGSFTVNGVPAPDVMAESWARRAAYVPQQAVVFDGTIRENIRFYREWITDEDIEFAAREAQIDDEIRAMPDGYETSVAGLSLALSGGQRQRVCIARALAGRPELLVLDEPTSALDVYSEKMFVETIHRLRGETTMLVIAHRLETVAMCDQIVVVEKGRIAARGTPSQILGDGKFLRVFEQEMA